jgi:hypothetical protein
LCLVLRARQLLIGDSDKMNTFVKVKDLLYKIIKIFVYLLGYISS